MSPQSEAKLTPRELEDLLEKNDPSLRRFYIRYQISVAGHTRNKIAGIFAVEPNRLGCFHPDKIAAALERHPQFPRSHIIKRKITLNGNEDPTESLFRELWESSRILYVELKAVQKKGDQGISNLNLPSEQRNCEEKADSVIAMYYADREGNRRHEQGEEFVKMEEIHGFVRPKQPSPDSARQWFGTDVTAYNVNQVLDEAVARIDAIRGAEVSEKTKQRVMEGLLKALKVGVDVDRELDRAAVLIGRVRRMSQVNEKNELIARGLLDVLQDVEVVEEAEEAPEEPESHQSKVIGKQQNPQIGSAQDPGNIRAGNTRKKASRGQNAETQSDDSEDASERRKPRSSRSKHLEGEKGSPEAGTSTQEAEESRVDTEEKPEGAPRAEIDDDSQGDYFETLKVRGLP